VLNTFDLPNRTTLAAPRLVKERFAKNLFNLLDLSELRIYIWTKGKECGVSLGDYLGENFGI
jgi:hypothetical protein